MAIVHADDFAIYGENHLLLTDGIYAQVSPLNRLVPDPSGLGGTVIRFSAGTTNSYIFIRKLLPAGASTVGVAGRHWLVRIPATPSARPVITQFRDSANVDMYSVVIDTAGRVCIRQGSDSGPDLAVSAGPVVTPNGWYHFESKAVISPTAGSIEVRVEGRTVAKIEDINTGTQEIRQITVGQRLTGEQTETYFKDFVLWDGSGSENTDFIGTVQLAPLNLTADVSLNWTPSVGATGFSILRNAPPNTAQYITAANPPPAAYVGELSNLPADVTSVKGIVTYIRAAKVDGGDASLQVGLISSPSDDPDTVLGADRPITTAETYWTDVFEVDPKTNMPWSPTATDLAQITIDRTS